MSIPRFFSFFSFFYFVVFIFIYYYIFFITKRPRGPLTSTLHPLSKTSQASSSLCISFQMFKLSYVQFPPISLAFSTSPSPSPPPSSSCPSPSSSSLSFYFPPLPSFSRPYTPFSQPLLRSIFILSPLPRDNCLINVPISSPKFRWQNYSENPMSLGSCHHFCLLDLYFFPLLSRAAHMHQLFSFSWASYSTPIAIL